MKNIIYGIVLLLVSPALLAESVYKGTDANGNVIFSDQPIQNGQKIKVQPLSTYSPTPVPAENTDTQDNNKNVPVVYELNIITPTNEQNFTNDIVHIEVQLAILPKLQAHDAVRLILNGQPFGEIAHATTFHLNNLSRGIYKLSAEIVSLEDPSTIKAHSDTITFFQQRSVDSNANGNMLAPQAPKGPQAPPGPHVY